jgi:hypothetical protein
MKKSELKNIIKEIIKEETSKPEGYTYKFVSWFSSTSLNGVKHPIYGKHQITPEQIKNSSKEYKDKMFKEIKKQISKGNITQNMILKYS